ncbi:MAG TPA: LLM class flavin-dependent oxidoreductase [Acidimicrobiales bacterium]|jgi:alkanesulfonate monooxygenase SsuD/methylene tetrahydromethanopterin reductase-like flavin-dependent oxidoreductase (luciferase family)|nr:LLM class flavin-dependent oxidoreductase [Acidimicrobiales bacterium]
MTAPLEFWLYLPQMRLGMDDIAARARAAEAAGFRGMAGMDHLAPPAAESLPMFEAMTTNAWVAAKTSDLLVGSLVLCDSFRHPVVLAKEAVTIDRASGGRFELGIGWGSVTDEFEAYGVGSTDPKYRVGRLKESLEIMQALWRGEAFDYEGEHFTLRAARQQPTPLARIPIVIGGAGRKTMELVAAHADWWNVHVSILDRFDEMRDRAGPARCSLQVQVALVAPGADRDAVDETARRRFWGGHVLGTAPELVDYFGGLADRGVERAYVWFTDFAPVETLEAFGQEVIGSLSPPA